ncbi:FxsA family protein [Rhizomonospora bruguierae]|uniref:FxsA family protein n=1 Tax=Rhizomonospora bruguierae TaxID=1581705 RepID=UPI001BCCD804|nr:FxsA family protein [Micromonospora sp. NBRC 107566]
MRRGLTLIPLAVLLTAIVEIIVFALVSWQIGIGWAALLVIAASLTGGYLLKREGIRAWRGFRDAAASGRPPGAQVTDGVVGLAGALLLAIPGLLTGLVGVLALVPPVRRLVRARVQHAVEGRVSAAAAGDLFGPRRVRVRRGAPVDEPVVATPPSGAIEGEIIEPEPRR